MPKIIAIYNLSYIPKIEIQPPLPNKDIMIYNSKEGQTTIDRGGNIKVAKSQEVTKISILISIKGSENIN